MCWARFRGGFRIPDQTGKEEEWLGGKEGGRAEVGG